MDELRQALLLAWPGETSRCRVLLAWCSAGTNRYSGIPVHETIPGILLDELPVTAVLEVLKPDHADDRAWSGAMRHLAAWHARTATELRSVPKSIRPRLLAIAEQQDEVQARRLRQGWQPLR